MSLQSVEIINYFLKQVENVRTNPDSIIKHLQQRRFVEDNQFVHSQLSNIRYKTQEGKQAVQQAIEFLQKMNPVGKLKLSGNICQAAYRVGCIMAKQTHIQNPQDYQKAMIQELAKLGVVNYGDIWMVIEYGFRLDPQIIPSVVVDDGDKRRTRRDWLLHERAKFIGISVHEHSQFDYMLLMVLTDSLEESKSGCSCRIF